MTEEERQELMEEFITALGEYNLIEFAIKHDLSPYLYSREDKTGMHGYYNLVTKEFLAKINGEEDDEEDGVVTCGQVAYEAFFKIHDPEDWEEEAEATQHDWETAANAVICHNEEIEEAYETRADKEESDKGEDD